MGGVPVDAEATTGGGGCEIDADADDDALALVLELEPTPTLAVLEGVAPAAERVGLPGGVPCTADDDEAGDTRGTPVSDADADAEALALRLPGSTAEEAGVGGIPEGVALPASAVGEPVVVDVSVGDGVRVAGAPLPLALALALALALSLPAPACSCRSGLPGPPSRGMPRGGRLAPACRDTGGDGAPDAGKPRRRRVLSAGVAMPAALGSPAPAGWASTHPSIASSTASSRMARDQRILPGQAGGYRGAPEGKGRR